MKMSQISPKSDKFPCAVLAPFASFSLARPRQDRLSRQSRLGPNIHTRQRVSLGCPKIDLNKKLVISFWQEVFPMSHFP